MMTRALTETAPLWPPIRRAYAWVHQAAPALAKHAGHSGARVRQHLDGLGGAMTRWQATTGPLASTIAHFCAVTRRYRAGLFWCYEIAGVPRTNNDLEQLFGTVRYRERRASGRKGASPSLVVRGPVRALAILGTPPEGLRGASLAPASVAAWRHMRATLMPRHEHRRQQLRFRRDPSKYLGALETQCLTAILPA